MRNRGTSLTFLIYSICESPKPTAHLRMKRLRFPTKIRTLSHLLSPLLLNITLEQPAKKKKKMKKMTTALVVQWLRIHPPTQGTPIQSLVQKDPTSCGTTKTVCQTTKPTL